MGKIWEVEHTIQDKSDTTVSDKAALWVCVRGKALHNSLVSKAGQDLLYW